jgi:TolA-binding protein
MIAKRALTLTILLLCILVLCPGGRAEAEDRSRLYRIERVRETETTLFTFTLSAIPEYEVNTSGQRLDVILHETDPADTLQDLEAGGGLIRTLIAEKRERTIVSLVLRRPPDDVEYSTSSREEPVLRVKVTWPERGRRSRPGISMDMGGHLTIREERGILTRTPSSPYSGDWLSFFREHDPPIRIEPERVYTLPAFPAFILERDRGLLPQKALASAETGRWKKAEAALARNATGKLTRKEHLIREIAKAEILLHREMTARAAEVLRRLPGYISGEYASALSCLRVYTPAARGNPYLARERAKELDVFDEMPRKWRSTARLLRIETALGAGYPEEAYAIASDQPEDEFGSPDLLALRRAQAGFAVGKREEAIGELSDLPKRILESHPRALALLARYRYDSGDYGKALERYSGLAQNLSDLEKRAMAEFGEAMAHLRRGATIMAREGLRKIVEEFKETRAAWRARMELADLRVLRENERGKGLADTYKNIAEGAYHRELREEAAFKRILVAELSGHSYTAVQWLGPFLREYFTGEIAPHGRALLVEILPGVVKDLLENETPVRALALVQRHNETLRRASLPLDFLYDLGKTFSDFGFAERAVQVYQYMLSMAGKPEERQDVYPRLVRSYLDQEEYKRARRYAGEYLEKYPQGQHRRLMYYLLVKSLREKDRTERAAELLRAPDRPVSRDLDVLAGKVLFSLGQYNEAHRYLARAAPRWRNASREVLLLRAESLYRTGGYQQARPMYAHLRKGGYQHELASYRMGQIAMENDRGERGAKLWQDIVDRNTSPLWKSLAGEGLAIHDLEQRSD